MKTSIKTFAALAFGALLSSIASADSLTVSDLHAQRADLSGKQVTISGKVIKVNNGIMRRNFIHVQDETRAGENDRAIFTSQQTANVGDTVTATGTVKLDTDFGMGYFYPTLVEESNFELAK